MANTARGEASLACEGRTLTLCLTLGALAEIEAALEGDVAARMARLKAGELVAVLRALLKGGGEIPSGHYEAENMKQTVVPFRNAIMLSIACGFAESIGAGGLVIAAHGGDHAIYPDCREPFMRAMADAMRLGTYAGVELLRRVYERFPETVRIILTGFADSEATISEANG